MIDLKKIIGTFLLLASLTASFVLVFFAYPTNSKPAANQTDQEAALAPIGDNAFGDVSAMTGTGDNSVVTGDNSVATGDNNYTANLANRLALEVISSNPDGPIDMGGDSNIVVPNNEHLTTVIDQNLTNLSGSFALTEKLKPGDINIQAKYTPDDIKSYFASINDILKNTLGGPRFKSLLDQEPSDDLINAAEIAYNEAIAKLKTIPVPQPIYAFHEKTLLAFVHQSELLQIASNREDDPLKTLIAAKNNDKILAQDLADIQVASKELDVNLISYFQNRHESATFVSQIFGIPEAHAQFLFVPTFDPFDTHVNTVNAVIAGGNLGHRIYEFAKKLVTEVLKDRLIHMLVQQVISWVQGGGKPQFITNWRGFLSRAGNEAAGLAISGIAPGLCQSFGPLVKLQLVAAYNTSAVGGISCTIDSVISDINGFYNNFQYGGWLAYGATSLPDGNYFGQIFEGSQIVDLHKNEGAGAANSEGKSNGGFLSMKICDEVDTEAPPQQQLDPNYKIQYDPTTGIPLPIPASAYTYKQPCKKQITTTPGGVIAHITGVATGDSVINHIVSAQDFIALIDALINSGLNHLIQAGIGGITGMLNSSGGGGSSSISSICSNLTGAAQANCLGSAGSVNGTISGAPTGPTSGQDIFNGTSSTIPLTTPTGGGASSTATTTVGTASSTATSTIGTASSTATSTATSTLP